MMVASTVFSELLHNAQQTNNSLLCVGLDPDIHQFPEGFTKEPESVLAFNRAIIEATSDLASCYKPNLGFYLRYGKSGIDALADLRQAIPAHIPVLLDAKIGDIDTTTAAYANAYFDEWRFDAVTAHPFMGHDSLQPLLDYADRCVFVLTKTSNPGSGFLQDRVLDSSDQRVSILVARHAVKWNVAGNVGLVVGATYPRDLAEVRAVARDLPILVPGIGPQSGELEASVKAGIDGNGAGLLLNASRAICYASSGSDFQDAARSAAISLRGRINAARASS